VTIGALRLLPYTVPHDAAEPLQLRCSDGAASLGVLTDAGSITGHLLEHLRGCAALLLECNHDAAMLADGSYPANLKARISGRYGHLANEASAELLAAIDGSRLRHVVAAHLSKQNNTPSLARAALAGALGCGEDWIGVADQDIGFDWREI
jgi:phosphoribosyl 1,2-cyclic phosphodiesterase